MSIKHLASEYVSGFVANNMDTIDQISKNLMGTMTSSMTTNSSIKMNMYEKNNKYYYEFEIPGIEKENIQLQQTEGFIKISGERKYKNEIQKENYHTIESSFGKFERKFRLPIQANPKSIDAKFTNGMLIISVNKIIENDEYMNKIEIS